jgi:hypothetical protein
MTSYEDRSLLIDRLPAGVVVDQDCAKSCQTVLPIPCADGHTPAATALGLLSPTHSPGTLCGRLVDLNKSTNSAIALCAS